VDGFVGGNAVCLIAQLTADAELARTGTPSTPHTTPVPEMRIDINHATQDELLKVPGMTPSWAGRIVRFRPYRSKQDLLDKGVVDSEVYDRIKDCIIAHRGKP
jgi:competence protein ComEA